MDWWKDIDVTDEATVSIFRTNESSRPRRASIEHRR
jgi:hypothetical protein